MRRPSPMHDPQAQEIIELLTRVADVKQRLRQLETLRSVSGGEPPQGLADLPAGAFSRAKNHLELALEALGTPTWGFASTPASSLKITGFYSADIYKALKDIRSQARGQESKPDSQGLREAEVTPSPESMGWDNTGALSNDWSLNLGDGSSPSADSAPTAPEDSGETGGDGSSVWVQHRVNEIHRALSAAFGDDEALAVEEEQEPKPFSPPEFIGSTDALSIPELIGFFQLQRKTGVLTIDGPHEQFTLEYLRGELIHARSSSAPDGQRLGEVLVQLGYLTESKLERLLAGKSDAERLGDALRRGELVGEDALGEALQYQIQNIFYRLFDLQGCRFTFREGLEGEPHARVRYNVTRLLLETARHHDERDNSNDARRAG